MYNLYQIKKLHLELTDKCNAKCAMCGRNQFGGKTQEFIRQREISLEDFQKFFPNSLLDQLEELRLCGNFGDPIMASSLVDILAWSRQLNPELIFKLNTNGSVHDKKWWEKLSPYFSQKKDLVQFALDGLEDTHHIYRKNTSFEKIIENAKSFIGNGGNAEWVMLVFKHNEHQVEICRELALKLGFKSFKLKTTKRFYDHINEKKLTAYPVRDRLGNIEYEIFPAIKKDYTFKEKANSMTSTVCWAKENSSIYVDSGGNLFPCCWLGNKPSNLIGNLHESELETLISNSRFQNDIPKNWDKNKTCLRVCGHNQSQFRSQFLTTVRLAIKN